MRLSSIRARLLVAGLALLVGGLGLSGCTDQGAAEEPGQGPSPGQSATQSPEGTAPPENTATPDPQTTEQPEPATTPVPPPSPGTINETVESRPVPTKDSVPLDRTGSFDDEVTIEITGIESIADPKTGMPDEVPGPALAITAKITNDTSQAVSADAVVLEVLDADDAPGTRLTGDPHDPIEGEIKAGDSASGTYVYAVPEDRRDPITVVVTLSAADPVGVFEGPVR